MVSYDFTQEINLLYFSSLKRITKISTINKLICGVVNNLQNAFGQKTDERGDWLRVRKSYLGFV